MAYDPEDDAVSGSDPRFQPCPRCAMAMPRGARFCPHCGNHTASMTPHPAMDRPDLMTMPSPYAEAIGAAETPAKTTGSSGRGPSPSERRAAIAEVERTLTESILAELDADAERELAAGDFELAQAEADEHRARQQLAGVLSRLYPRDKARSLSDRVQGARIAASRGELGPVSPNDVEGLLQAHEAWLAATKASEQARRQQNTRLERRRY